jgi:murein DD-endopeptidase MepM/ murein hydrolase activator NlpD
VRSAAPPAGAPSNGDSALLAGLEAEAEHLRGLLERGPLAHGCNPAHDHIPAPQPPETTGPVAVRRLASFTRLDAVDAEADTLLESLQMANGHDGAPAVALPHAAVARTFRMGMEGEDILAWQHHLNRRLRAWHINYQVGVDGDYGPESERWSRRVLYGSGLSNADWNGVTPDARFKSRHLDSRTPEELAAAARRRDWRRRLRRKFKSGKVHTPVEKIITSSWGYHPGVHDGVDLICPADAKIFAVCRARVIDVRAGGWWGNNPSGDIAKGDGIIQLEALESHGPLKKGMHIGYGHAEHAQVEVGQIVEPGQVLGRAGLAVAWHVHFMVNDGSQGTRGIGNLDPRLCLNLFTGQA